MLVKTLDEIEDLIAYQEARTRKPKDPKKPWKVVFEYENRNDASYYDSDTDTIHYYLGDELDEYTLSHELIHAVLERVDPVASVLIDVIRYGFLGDDVGE